MQTATNTITTLLDADMLNEALAAVDASIVDGSSSVATLHFLRGKILWRLGRRSEARREYSVAADLDPDGPAQRALELASDIEDFFNPDIYNP